MEVFDVQRCLHQLKHFLPSQSPLKDFIHHNTLHGFQHLHFFDGIGTARKWFGYQVYMSLHEFREKYQSGLISDRIIADVIKKYAPKQQTSEYWQSQMHQGKFELANYPTVGRLRDQWKFRYGVDFDVFIHPVLFQMVGAYLDQGIASWNFPYADKPFWTAMQLLEQNSAVGILQTDRAKKLLFDADLSLETLLFMLLGSRELFEQYIYDQQFAHAGWSGLVASIEEKPETLLHKRYITLEELIKFQLILELDFLYLRMGDQWFPMNHWVDQHYVSTPFQTFEATELDTVLMLWQRSLENTYYHEVLSALQFNAILSNSNHGASEPMIQSRSVPSFQAMFCIDDRECSIRRHLEATDPNCETIGTPGFFNLEFYYKPDGSNFITKHCPAPVNPKYLIKEVNAKKKHKNDIHFNTSSHTLLGGWIIAQFVGFWSALKLVKGMFFPSMDGNSASSLNHLGEEATLTIECTGETENGLQVGYTLDEMVARALGLFQSIGMMDSFASFVYIVGHGSSTTNNPHYAAYDCGACSGRPGSVNARAMASILNRQDVRWALANSGVIIPESTVFVGALHDTTRDEIVFYTKDLPLQWNSALHAQNESVFKTALDLNAKERSRRFVLINPKLPAKLAHQKVKLRSVSVFEPRPELNHATNALCLIGKREFSQKVFLDRRAFLNTYNWQLDSSGDALYSIIKATAPVCGGINLEYYFSRVDNNALGAGSKLPHNVVGLLGVSNGVAGDLRTGLPSQMIEVHDPLRLLMIVEQLPEVVKTVIQRDSTTYQWFKNEWVNLVVFHPEEQRFYEFQQEQFIPYTLDRQHIPVKRMNTEIFESSSENLPVLIME